MSNTQETSTPMAISSPEIDTRMRQHEQKINTIVKKHTSAYNRLSEIKRELANDEALKAASTISLTAAKPKNDMIVVRKYLKRLAGENVYTTDRITILKHIATYVNNYEF